MPKQLMMPNDAQLDGLIALLKLTKLLANENQTAKSALDLNFNAPTVASVLKTHPQLKLTDCILGMQYLAQPNHPHHNYYLIGDAQPFENFCHYVKTDDNVDMFIDSFGPRAFQKLIDDIIDIVKTKFQLN